MISEEDFINTINKFFDEMPQEFVDTIFYGKRIRIKIREIAIRPWPYFEKYFFVNRETNEETNIIRLDCDHEAFDSVQELREKLIRTVKNLFLKEIMT